jgi:2-dehydro-3-deoxyphosphogluconate aldolase/(4S)-4-hydroxy-2-oxoglutarate aldolase
MTAEGLRHGPVAAAIRACRLIVVLRRVPPGAPLLALVGDLADAGARAFELDFDTPTAEADLAAVRAGLAARRDGPYLVGAGAIVRRKELEAARRAGADFGASTLLDPTLVETATSEGLPFIPGAFTPSEVHAAWAAGATFVKLFPASAVGPTFVRELRGPLPDAELIAAGGLDAASAPAFLEAGAPAVAIGRAFAEADAAGRRALVAAIGGGEPAPRAGAA